MKQIFSIYIDNFNFYNSAIRYKGSQYYYPSLRDLCRLTLESFRNIQNPSLEFEIKEIHLFTAEVKNTSEDATKLQRQRNYHNELQKRDDIKIHIGEFKYEEKEIFDSSGKIRFEQTLKEKQSDVHLAVCMLNDAWRNEYDHSVLVSNDSDFAKLISTVVEQGKIVSVWYTGSRPTAKLASNAHYTHPIEPEAIQATGPIANIDFTDNNINYP